MCTIGHNNYHYYSKDTDYNNDIGLSYKLILAGATEVALWSNTIIEQT